jgi:virginiamycin B lyase
MGERSSRQTRKWNSWRAGALCTILVFASAAAQASKVTYTQSTTKVNGHKITIFSKPTDDSGALRIVNGASQSLWFGELSLGTIVKFSTNGVATAYSVPISGANIHGLSLGGDGNMWFADFNSDKVGRVNSMGKFKTFDTTANPTNSNQMTIGGDGSLWFATNFNGIGRTTTSGNTTFFNVLNNSTQPTSLTVGPSNEIWFAEWAGSNVGYIDNGGGVHEFDAGFDGFSNTFGIAYGSDGRIWFCDPQHGRISAINVDGSGLMHYSVGLTGQPDSIVSGPDGNLYFGEFDNAIGKITTGGAITEYPLPQSEGIFPVLGITVGPDNNIWFSNNQHAQIGRFKIARK